MNEADLISVHETGIAHHVATVRKVNGQDSAAAIFNSARTVVVQFLVTMRIDIATWEHLFDVGKKFYVDGHHVFEVPVYRAIFYHPYFAITLNNLRLDLANLLIDENTNVLLAAQTCFPCFDYAIRTKRICGSRPAQRWFTLLPGFQQRLV